MAVRPDIISVELGEDLLKMVNQRAKQEGVNRSEYIREAIILEMLFSGDVEAMGFVAKNVGKRIKTAVLERIGHADLEQLGAVLTK